MPSLNLTSSALSGLAISTALSLSPALASERENILWHVNVLLSFWEQSVSQGSESHIVIESWKFRYTYTSWSIEWSRGYRYTHDGSHASVQFGISTDTESHEFSYGFVDTERFKFRAWVWALILSNTRWFATLDISHSAFGSHAWEVSHRIWETLYDPFISLWVSAEYPVWRDTDISIWADYTHSMYTQSWDIHVWLKYSPTQKLSVFWVLWVSSFRFHWGDPEVDIANTFLWNTGGDLTVWGQYCLNNDICLKAWANHVLSGPWKWNTSGFGWINIKF